MELFVSRCSLAQRVVKFGSGSAGLGIRVQHRFYPPWKRNGTLISSSPDFRFMQFSGVMRGLFLTQKSQNRRYSAGVILRTGGSSILSRCGNLSIRFFPYPMLQLCIDLVIGILAAQIAQILQIKPTFKKEVHHIRHVFGFTPR